MCGKTSTAMISGEILVGDDISYIRKINDKAHAVNVESGVFGIITDVNKEDDPIIWEVLHSPNEIIFTNVLFNDGKTYWMGMEEEIPDRGENHSGSWYKGKKDREGNEITPSHKNGRFTVDLKCFKNLDPRLNDPNGLELGGIIYGGRDSDTWVPVCQAFDWTHGIIMKGASIESETTAATLGEEGVRKFNPFSNLDFTSLPIGKYIDINLKFGSSLRKPPLIFGVNYFLKGKNGSFFNGILDKGVWLKWMELRVHDEVDALETSIGYIPKYEDLKTLFKQVLNKEYLREDYNKQFTVRIPENLAKIERIEKIYKTTVKDTPSVLFEVLEEERERLFSAKEKYGDYVIADQFRRSKGQ
jgi:phosphoenolpyruvate carboxykinase (GTP)